MLKKFSILSIILLLSVTLCSQEKKVSSVSTDAAKVQTGIDRASLIEFAKKQMGIPTGGPVQIRRRGSTAQVSSGMYSTILTLICREVPVITKPLELL